MIVIVQGNNSAGAGAYLLYLDIYIAYCAVSAAAQAQGFASAKPSSHTMR